MKFGFTIHDAPAGANKRKKARKLVRLYHRFASNEIESTADEDLLAWANQNKRVE